MLLSNLWIVLLFQLLLTFPGGRLQTDRERLLLAGAWVSGLVLAVPPLLFLEHLPDPEVCDGCPDEPDPDRRRSDRRPGLLLRSSARSRSRSCSACWCCWCDAGAAPRGRSAAPSRRCSGRAGSPSALIAAPAHRPLDQRPPRGVTDAIFIVCCSLPFTAVPYAFLLGFLRTASLARDRGRRAARGPARPAGPRAGRLATRLAEALGDPVARARLLARRGGSLRRPRGQRDRAARAGGERLVSAWSSARAAGSAALICDPALGDQTRLVDAVGAAAALALENERLEAELRARVEELRASRARIVEAADAERRRLERDLHDGAQQQLVALALSLRLARDKAAQLDPRRRRTLLDEAMGELELATAELRELARGHPPGGAHRPRPAGGGRGARRPRAACRSRSSALPERAAAERVEAAAYFVVAEALTNVARYAQASGAAVAVAQRDGELDVEVTDDGRRRAPTRPRARACAGSPTGSRRSTARSRSRSPPSAPGRR